MYNSENLNIIKTDELNDVANSIRLNKRSCPILTSTDDNNVSNSYSIDYSDIEQLDTELERISRQAHNQIAELRKIQNSSNFQYKFNATQQTLLRMKTWSSLLNTHDVLKMAQNNATERYEYQVNQRKYEIDEILKLSKSQSTVDLCFLMDCTGSMRKYLHSVKTQIHQLTETFIRLYRIKPNLAFVGYRDLYENIEKLDFTNHENVFQEFINGIHAVGGDDICEDVFSGLELIPKLKWSSANRILIHICDAPCHGREYHGHSADIDDNYATGDPKRRQMPSLILNIKRLDIKYCKIELNETTRKMFEEFALVFGPIEEIHVSDPVYLTRSIIKRTSQIIQKNIDSAISAHRNKNTNTKSYIICEKEPNWVEIQSQNVHIIEVNPPNTIDELFQPFSINITDGQIKIAPHPFSKGALRFAFYGQYSDGDNNSVDVVFKELTNTDPNENTWSVYREHLEIQSVAQLLAEKFNIEQNKCFQYSIPIIYADANVVQLKSDRTKLYQVERRMHEKWFKWNNNSGGVSLDDYSTVLQAFSHWTYEITSGRLMVVDLQGVKVDHAYLLTDPAIHSDDILRFRETRTNLSVKGMREFFRTHICNDNCLALGLSSPTITATAITTTTSSVSNLFDSDPLLDNAVTKANEELILKTIGRHGFETLDKDLSHTTENFELC